MPSPSELTNIELTHQEVDEIFQSMQLPLDKLHPLPYFSSIYKIGNACLKKQDLNKLINKLNPIQTEHLWVAAMLYDSTVFSSVDPNKASVEAFKNLVTQQIELLPYIGTEALMKLGQDNENNYRKVLMIFIKNHLNNKTAFENFNYAILTEGTSEQTKLSVWPVIKKCEHLPKALIKELGKKHSKIARNILFDIEPHPEAQEIADFFQAHHKWPKPVIEKPVLPKAERSFGPNLKPEQSLIEAIKSPFSNHKNSYINNIKIWDIIVAVSSGVFFWFRSSIIRALPVAPYAAAPILTLYGLYRIKQCYDNNQNVNKLSSDNTHYKPKLDLK